MKLSDLLKQAKTANDAYGIYASFGGGGPLANTGYGVLNTILNKSINKSSPGFKATTTNQAGVPVATDMQPQPEPIRDQSGKPIATPVDWNADYAYRAQQGDTAAQDWIDQNTIDDTQQTDTSGGYDFGGGNNIDFSTPTSNVAYSMEKLNELYGTKSPEDLWALRQKLRLQESQASAGMLPEEEYMKFSGEGVTDGAPRYNYDQRMGVNRATADIFSTQVSDLDKFMSDYSKGQTASGSSGLSGVPQQYSSIINSSSLGKTADERAINRQDLARAALEGDDAFITALIGKGEPALDGEARKIFDQRITNAEQLDQFINAVQSGNIKLGNLQSIKQSALKKFGAQSPEYAMANFLSGGVSAQERNRLFGASLTGTEKEDASQFIITPQDTPQIAIEKAKAMKATMSYANDLAALTKAGVPRSQITTWQNQGRLRSLNDYLLESGVPQTSVLVKKPNPNDKNITYTERQFLKSNGLTDEQIDTEFGFKKVGSGTNTATGNPAGTNRPQRNNNPLNIKVSSFTSKFPGVKGIDGKPAADGGHFLVFNSPQDGFNAAVKLFKEGKSYQGKTVDQALRIWSNNGYGGNIVPQYANMPIQSLPDSVLQQIIQRMANAEGYYA